MTTFVTVKPENTIQLSNMIKILGITKKTALKWIADGNLQSYKTPNGHHFIDKTSIQEFLAKRNNTTDYTIIWGEYD